MGSKSIEAPAFISLLMFLGINYICGYQLGHLLTGSSAFGIALALAMPLISLVVFALVRVKVRETSSLPDA